jgi:hypothetical protein
MSQQHWAPIVASSDQSEVELRYTTILHSLKALLPGHAALIDELDASVSELLAEADDRARIPAAVQDAPGAIAAAQPATGRPTPAATRPRTRRGGHR